MAQSRSVHAKQRTRRYPEGVATIQIRNVPEDVHRAYRVRAAAAGMSLQEYLLDELTANAGTKSPAEVMAEIEEEIARGEFVGVTCSPQEIVDIIREDRESH
jgi:plasmid stability protein